MQTAGPDFPKKSMLEKMKDSQGTCLNKSTSGTRDFLHVIIVSIREQKIIHKGHYWGNCGNSSVGSTLGYIRI